MIQFLIRNLGVLLISLLYTISASAQNSSLFIIPDRGRHSEEQSLILIENGNFCGYGYMDASDSVSDQQDLVRLIKRQPFHPDCNDIVRGRLKQNPRVKKVSIG